MNNLKSNIFNKPRLELAELIENLDSESLEKAFSLNDKRVYEKLLGTGIIQTNNRILKAIELNKIFDALLLISNDAKWRFLRNITKGQLHAISRLASNYPDEKIIPLIESAPTRNLRIELISKFPIEKRNKYLSLINQVESEIEYLRTKSTDANNDLIAEKSRLIDELSEAISAKEQLLKDHENELLRKKEILQHDINRAHMQLAEIQQRTAAEEAMRKKREEDIDKKIAELNEANRIQVQQRIEVKVPEYVAAAVALLEKRENEYKKKASHWGVHGTIVLFIAIITTGLISFYGSGLFGENSDSMTWPILVFISFKGLIVLGVLGLWAKHAFSVSNAYMHEAIKRSDRAHAINFGKLYLEIYGNSVDRKELLDIFENWNITSESAFSKVSPDFEPKIIDKFSEVIKSLQGNNSK